MAKDKSLELSIKIAGQLDKSLNTALNKTTSKLNSFAKDVSKTLSKIGTVGLAAMTGFATGAVAAIKDCTEEAKNFEQSMADVVKYVDGLADAYGKVSDTVDETTGRTFKQNYDIMKDTLLDLSTQIPMTAEDLTRLAAAAGQSGKAMDELVQFDDNGNISGFLKDVAMMATAMDISADQAGDWAAKWEKSFNMTHDEIMVVADQINYLGANSATTAAEIAQAVNDAAALGQIAGADVSTTAALADAMLATGVASGKVATSIKRTYTNLSKGASATKAQKELWAQLGFTAEGVAQSMQQDATGTLIAIYEAIDAMPKENQVAALSTLFGQWAIEGNAKIVGNLSTYTDALKMVSDPSIYGGSMEREFNIKAGTSASLDMMAQNALNNLKVDFGDAFLPAKQQIATAMVDLLNGLRKNMPELKQFGETLATLLTKGINKLGDAVQKALPYVQKALDYVNNHGDKVVSVIKNIALTFAGLKLAPAATTILGGIGGLLGSGGKGAVSGVSSLIKGGKKGGGILSTLFSGAVTGAGLAGNASLTNGGMSGRFGGILNRLTGAFFGMKNATGLASGSDKAMFGSLMNTASSITGVQNNGILGTLKGLFSNSKAGSYLGNVGSAFGEVKNNAIVSSITNGFKQAGGFIKMGFGGLGSGFGQLFSMAGSGIANSKVGQFVGGAASKIGGFMGSVGGGLKTGASMLANSSIGKLGGSMLNLSTTMLSPVTSMFGGILSGALPVVGVVSGIIALFSILGDNLDGIRGLVESVFGEAGVKVFDSFTGGLKNILGFIKNIFNGGLAAALAPVKKMILNLFGGNEAPAVVGETFDSIVNIVQSALGVIGQLVDFSVNYIKPIILNVFNFIVNTVMPIILNIFNTVAPIISSLITNIGSAVMNVATIIAEAIQFIWPLIEGVITVVLNIAEVVIPMALAAFNVLWETISSVVDGIKNIFEGVIQFITGIFSGEWKKAWEGIKNIFGGIFETLGALFKAPINVIITLINKAISGINNLGIEIPDWVPFLGGKKFGLDIPEIPLLAKGGFTNGPAIAGEAGTEAVISFARSVRKKNLDTWLTAGQMLGVDFGGAVKELKKIDTGGMGSNITFAPQITINGNADERTVDYMVNQMRDMFEEWFENKVRRQARTAY